MINTTNKRKRIGVFFQYDPHGIADNSVLYFLQEARPYFEKLFVVVNGLLTLESREALTKIADEILVREDKGYSPWAYKAAIDKLGWSQIEQYDELTLFDFTNFGPLYPFSEMFEVMSIKDVDFWGITKNYGCGSQKQTSEHIQLYWISFNKSMLNSQLFRGYWEGLPKIGTYEDYLNKFKIKFTHFFENQGFKWDVYLNTDNLKEYGKNPLLYSPLALIKDYRCPIIKKRCFFNNYHNVLSHNTGEEIVGAFEYIKSNLNYDINFIWENILRLHNYADIKNNLHLNYILPSNVLLPANNKVRHQEKVALIIHIYFLDLIEYCFSYAKSIPSDADVYITTDSIEKKQLILEKFKELKCNKLEIRIIENRGRDVGALLVGCKDIILRYDLICFAHDKKTAQLKPLSLGKSFSYRCWENVLKNSVFVSNIIETFRENKRLGLLFSPPPYHRPFSSDKWCENFKTVKKLAEDMNLNVHIDINKQSIAPFGTIFWFRAEALRSLIEYDWKYEDFPQEPNKFDGTIIHAIERLYPYLAQQEGYYSGWSMSEEFASMEIESLSWFYNTSRTALGVKGNLKILLNSIAVYLGWKCPFLLKIISPVYIVTKNALRVIYYKIWSKD